MRIVKPNLLLIFGMTLLLAAMSYVCDGCASGNRADLSPKAQGVGDNSTAKAFSDLSARFELLSRQIETNQATSQTSGRDATSYSISGDGAVIGFIVLIVCVSGVGLAIVKLICAVRTRGAALDATIKGVEDASGPGAQVKAKIAAHADKLGVGSFLAQRVQKLTG